MKIGDNHNLHIKIGGDSIPLVYECIWHVCESWFVPDRCMDKQDQINLASFLILYVVY